VGEAESTRELPDVHEREPAFRVSLTRAGVKGIRKALVQESEEGRKTVLYALIDAFVDLMGSRKGAHFSRHNEAINECVERAASENIADVEVLCTNISRKLLEKSDGATRAEVHLSADLVLPRQAPASGSPVQKHYGILARALSWIEGEAIRTRKSIGIEATGMTVCPCGLELSREHARAKLIKEGFGEKEAELALALAPLASHNQRCRATLIVETGEGERIDAKDLVEIAEASMSSPTFEVLKREDEMKVIIKAHQNPLFVEDVVRNMLSGLLAAYPALPPDAIVTARCESAESIHAHNAFAEKTVSIGELREEG